MASKVGKARNANNPRSSTRFNAQEENVASYLMTALKSCNDDVLYYTHRRSIERLTSNEFPNTPVIQGVELTLVKQVLMDLEP